MTFRPPVDTINPIDFERKHFFLRPKFTERSTEIYSFTRFYWIDCNLHFEYPVEFSHDLTISSTFHFRNDEKLVRKYAFIENLLEIKTKTKQKNENGNEESHDLHKVESKTQKERRRVEKTTRFTQMK